MHSMLVGWSLRIEHGVQGVRCMPPVAMSPTGRHVALLSRRYSLMICDAGGRVAQEIDLMPLLPSVHLAAWCWTGCLRFNDRGNVLLLQADRQTVLSFEFAEQARWLYTDYSRLPKDVRKQVAAISAKDKAVAKYVIAQERGVQSAPTTLNPLNALVYF